MNLKNLLKNLEITAIYGRLEKDIEGISINSKNKLKNGLFVAIPGFNQDGHDFIQESIKNGAVAVISQRRVDIPPSSDVVQIIVNNTRVSLPLICRNFFNNPSKNFTLIGITGTNGKSTTCYLLNSIFKAAGMKTSFITTVESFMDEERVKFDRTTPESVDLNVFFRDSLKKQINFAFMEVSSHSIDLHRIDYLNFNTFIFTNLSRDHLDYHKTMEEYFNAKRKLFLKGFRHLYGGKNAIINIDDQYGKILYRDSDLQKTSYSIKEKNSDVWADEIKNSTSGIDMEINTSAGLRFKVRSALCGYFNVYNMLAAISAALRHGIDVDAIQEGLQNMAGVNGRFEKIKIENGAVIIVDYAHTPDGLENVLNTSLEILKPGGKVISVFGCGGDRDKGKRKTMGHISGKLADYTIITSDNPRTEDPLSIIGMIKEGIKDSGNTNYEIEPDRRLAIFKSLDMAGENDIVLIAGKGHEDYQDFGDYRIHFSDQETVRFWNEEQGK